MHTILKKLTIIPTLLVVMATFWSTLEITAYCDGYVTCNGTAPIPYYTCAADHLPRGTKVTINGHTWVVDDCFGGGYKNKLDLFLPDYDSCIKWGRRTMNVLIETPN